MGCCNRGREYVLFVLGNPCYQGRGDEPRIPEWMVGVQFWSLAKGGIEFIKKRRETLVQTAIREVWEESGRHPILRKLGMKILNI